MLQDTQERDWYLERFFGGPTGPYTFWLTELPTLNGFLSKVITSMLPEGAFSSWDQSIVDWTFFKCDAAQAALSMPAVLSPVDDSGNWPAMFAAVSQNCREADAKSGLPWAEHNENEPHKTKQQDSPSNPRRLEIARDMFDTETAAIETVGYTLTWLHYELARRPALQLRLRAELLTILPSQPRQEQGAPEIEHDFSLADPKHLDGLPLLDAVLQETLRVWPPVPGGQPRVTPGPCTLAGYADIPAGMRVQAAAAVLHRDARVFGPDPLEWRPERWVPVAEGGASSTEAIVEMRRWFWAWGSGSRKCVGIHFATHGQSLSSNPLRILLRVELDAVRVMHPMLVHC